MKLSTKAALWSAFAIPGAGQLILKRYLSGSIFIIISVISLTVIIVKLFDFAYSLANQISSDAVKLDMAGTIGVLGNSIVDAKVHIISIAVLVFFVTWIVSIVDAYRIGDSMDK